MHTLEVMQARMRKALLIDAHPPLDDIFGATASRFDVHKRHFLRSLTAALEKTFPGIVNLVDIRFFGFAADAFVRAYPPKSPCLFEYGAELPGFLQRFPPCAQLPYLGDVARLEWAMHEVFHAEEERPIRILSSRWPIDAIWRLAIGCTEDPVDMHAGGVDLVVYRDGDEVKFKQISPGTVLGTKGSPHVPS
jgi:hypothetical protein